MNKYQSYDIEIVNEFPEGEQPDLRTTIPSVAAICTNYENCQFFYDDPYMTKKTAQRLVEVMSDNLDNGIIPLTWNGLSFDFQLLAYYSDLLEQCGKLALNHVDMMFLVVAHKGFYLSLNKALVGANIQGKLHDVMLNDGKIFNSMDGSKAPLLWRNKEFSAVKEYLRVDVEQPLKLAEHIEKTKTIQWISGSGKIRKCFTDMLTVKEALKLPVPDTAWMANVKYRPEYYSWIPESVLKSEGII